jgi:PAS domain S-box-containing protein
VGCDRVYQRSRYSPSRRRLSVRQVLARLSIDRKLLVLVTGVLLATVSAFSWIAYRRIEGVELASAGERLKVVSAPIARMLEETSARHRVVLERMSTAPAIQEFLRSGAGRKAALAALADDSLAPDRPVPQRQLRDARGAIVLEGPRAKRVAGSGWIERTILGGTVRAGEVRAGPLWAADGQVYTQIVTGVAPPNDAGTHTPSPRTELPAPRSIGYIAEINAVVGRNVETVRSMVGPSAVLLIGSPGEGTWTDLERPTLPAPASLRVGEMLVFEEPGWGAGVGAATAIKGTPWLLWVHQPQSVVLASNRQTLLDLALLALGFILFGALLSALLARRITRPIVRLTHALEQLSRRKSVTGERSIMVAAHQSDPRRDEIERLTDAFARMSERVRESHDALTASEQRFRALIENASDPIAIVDDEGVVRYASPAYDGVLGQTPGELIGRRISAGVHAEDGPALANAMRELRAVPGFPIAVRARFQHKDGSWRMLAGSATNLLAEPAIAGFVFNWRDLTERLSLEAQLRHAQKMEAIGRLAGGIAHDLNNILTAISAFSQFALESLPAGSDVHEDIGQVQLAAQRAAGLTKQLLAFSRQQVMQPRPLDLNDVVSRIDGMLRRLIRADVTLSARLGPSLGLIMADPIQIEQVLLNLVLNARDAMPNGGTILIETGDVRLDDDYVRLHPEASAGAHVMLSVTDFGFGMDAETQGHIFEPFYTTKAIGHGTGLGLATVYGIVKQSGGSISVDSEVGRGSAFKIFLPLYEGVAEPELDVPAPVLREVGSATVLLVDDDDGVKHVARRALEGSGFIVHDARDGRDALAIVERLDRQLDLVITDLVMPDMGGTELALRLSERFPSLRVLFMSGYTADAMNRTTVLGPEDAFIEKPFTPRELIDKVTLTLRHDEKRSSSAAFVRRRSAS